ncbi:glycoside hydrolase domain-containing protein [Streptomyces sp. M19]
MGVRVRRAAVQDAGRGAARAHRPVQADAGRRVGNDDLGQMSSWAVWASLGMYPEAPGRSELVLASPLFPRSPSTGATARRSR